MSFVANIVAFVTFNVVIKQGRKCIVISIPMKISSLVIHVMILWGIIDTYISHMIISCIISTIQGFMTKIVARKTISKKGMLMPICKWSSWCHGFLNSFLLSKEVGFYWSSFIFFLFSSLLIEFLRVFA